MLNDYRDVSVNSRRRRRNNDNNEHTDISNNQFH